MNEETTSHYLCYISIMNILLECPLKRIDKYDLAYSLLHFSQSSSFLFIEIACFSLSFITSSLLQLLTRPLFQFVPSMSFDSIKQTEGVNRSKSVQYLHQRMVDEGIESSRWGYLILSLYSLSFPLSLIVIFIVSKQ